MALYWMGSKNRSTKHLLLSMSRYNVITISNISGSLPNIINMNQIRIRSGKLYMNMSNCGKRYAKNHFEEIKWFEPRNLNIMEPTCCQKATFNFNFQQQDYFVILEQILCVSKDFFRSNSPKKVEKNQPKFSNGNFNILKILGLKIYLPYYFTQNHCLAFKTST